MWRCGVVRRGGYPVIRGGNGAECRSNDGPRYVVVVRGCSKADVAQPDNPFFVVIELRAVVIVEFERVGFRVSVDKGLRVIGVSLVHVLLGQHQGDGEPRGQSESNDRAAEPG
jgi:hypothetical protein